MADFLTINPTAAERLAVESSIPYTAQKTDQVAMIARTLAPGSMKEKIRPVTLPGASPIGLVIVDHPAAIFVLHGTKAHKIYPKKPGGVLVFSPRGGSSRVFARIVDHPGTKANNFLEKALRLVP